MIHAFGGLHVGGVGAAFFHHFAQHLRIFQHGAGAQMVAVKGLFPVISHEQGAFEHFQQRVILDVHVGVVDEYAGFGVAVGVDVEIVPSAGNAAAHELAVVLEVHGVDLLAALVGADLANALDHILALFRRGHQLGGSAVAGGHEVEIPGEHAALFDFQIQELVGCDHLGVGTGIAHGGAIDQAVAVHQIHSAHDIVKMTGAAAAVVGFFKALEAQGERQIAHPDAFLAELLVDQGGVGERVELHVVVLFAQAQDILFAHQRLAAGEHIEVNAQLFALSDDIVHLLKGQVVVMAVFSGPAAGAAHVAGGGGIHQDQPGDVAVVFLAHFADGFGAAESSFEAQVQRGGFDHVGVQAVQVAVHKLHPFVFRVADIGADRFKGFFFERIAHELLGNIQHIQKTLAGVLFNVLKRHVQRHAERGALGLVRKSVHCGCHNSNSLISEMLCVLSVNGERASLPPNTAFGAAQPFR